MSTSSLHAGLVVAALSIAAGCGGAPRALHGKMAHPVTRDGWTLTVEHFPPDAGTPHRARPVLLCHGVLANHAFFELEGEASLPRVLARDGFDVWVADMRGRSDAGPPGWWFGDHTFDYDIDRIANEDVDALVSYVVAQTGAHDVAWVGHSMGGMIAYAHLGTTGDPRIGALVTVGSPGFFAPASRNLIRFAQLSPALALLPALPMQSLAAIDASLGLPVAPAMLTDTIYAQGNLPDEVYRDLERHSSTDAAKPELRQFLRSVAQGEFVSADGRVSYTEALGTIRTPTLVVVGRADELADPLVGRGVYERLASTDKELLVAGRAEGFAVDYGHVDLMLGPNARREIFPRLVGWLEAHAGP